MILFSACSFLAKHILSKVTGVIDVVVTSSPTFRLAHAFMSSYIFLSTMGVLFVAIIHFPK